MNEAHEMIKEIQGKLENGGIVMINRKQIEGAKFIEDFTVDATGHPCFRGNSIKYAAIRFYKRVPVAA